jgi:hypothetical protein
LFPSGMIVPFWICSYFSCICNKIDMCVTQNKHNFNHQLNCNTSTSGFSHVRKNCKRLAPIDAEHHIHRHKQAVLGCSDSHERQPAFFSSLGLRNKVKNRLRHVDGHVVRGLEIVSDGRCTSFEFYLQVGTCRLKNRRDTPLQRGFWSGLHVIASLFDSDHFNLPTDAGGGHSSASASRLLIYRSIS